MVRNYSKDGKEIKDLSEVKITNEEYLYQLHKIFERITARMVKDAFGSPAKEEKNGNQI